MITLIIGHRGSGKTKLLSFLEGPGRVCFDLDREISLAEGISITSIFSLKGEAYFRGLEKSVLYKIIQAHKISKTEVCISVGAGYQSLFPEGVRVIWLQRKTDDKGRIFFNRPRLDVNLSPSEEYKNKFKQREKYYESVAHKIICLPEYIALADFKHYQEQVTPSLGEGLGSELYFLKLQQLVELYFPSQDQFYVKKSYKELQKAGITLEEKMFHNKMEAEQFLQQRLDWGILFFEVRDDLITKETFNWIKTIVPLNTLLLSCRNKLTYFSEKDLESAWAWDWPLEKTLQACLFNIPFSIISFHGENGEGLDFQSVCEHLTLQIKLANQLNLEKNSSKKVHCKLAPEVCDFSQLNLLYDWFIQDTECRSILPRSDSGRWSWFRLYLYGKIKINFIKESRSSIFKDQILLADKFFTENSICQFSAILGSPISHSLTPFIHYDFFKKRNTSIFSIVLNPEEVVVGTVTFLQHLGLNCAAITSPLKKVFFNLKHSAVRHSERLERRKSVNTLSLQEGLKTLLLDNTDQEGLVFLMQALEEEIRKKKILDIQGMKNWKFALWGAGGVASMFAEAYPEMPIFSAQKSSCVSHKIDEDNYFPDIVLWAVPSMHPLFPPKHWSPKVVLDLNYGQDSLGREYALLKAAFYKSGILMLLKQAQEQQKIWLNYQ